MTKQKLESKSVKIEDPLEDINSVNIQSFDKPDQINNDFISQDEVKTDDVLLFYVNELLVSLEGVFIGGKASQKKDQLISYLYSRDMEGEA
jgi:hypothetical protein